MLSFEKQALRRAADFLLEREEWESDGVFFHHIVCLPAKHVQGVKLHISVADELDYVKTVKQLAIAMEQFHIAGKFLRPDFYHWFAPEGDELQTGKFVTVYPCAGDVVGFLEELKRLGYMDKDVIPVKNDTHLCGAIYGRFGSFTDDYLVLKSGKTVKDDRSVKYSRDSLMDALEKMLLHYC